MDPSRIHCLSEPWVLDRDEEAQRRLSADVQAEKPDEFHCLLRQRPSCSEQSFKTPEGNLSLEFFPPSSPSLFHFLRLKQNVLYEKSSVQHGVQLVGQVVKHVADVVQDRPRSLHSVRSTAERHDTQSISIHWNPESQILYWFVGEEGSLGTDLRNWTL